MFSPFFFILTPAVVLLSVFTFWVLFIYIWARLWDKDDVEFECEKLIVIIVASLCFAAVWPLTLLGACLYWIMRKIT